MRRTVPFAAAALLLAAGCAGAQSTSHNQPAPLPARPLAAYAARAVVVLPTHYLRPGDPMGWAAQISDVRGYLDEVDGEIAFALGDRGVKRLWVFPPRLVAAAKRNPGYAADPHDLAAEWLRPPMRRVPEQLPEPFASQVRTIIALQENTQYVLFPVEIRFEPAGEGKEGGRAVIHLVLLDARRSHIVWAADVASDPTTSFSPALAASAAEHIADLVAAR
ncbi:MAG: hypothetical protein IRY91_06790 [Gemmatimonadaceae bacterium]|nr:hypothetical protein [Gemmatimonadaceae bacterium]